MGPRFGLPVPGLACGWYNNCVRKGPRGRSFHTKTATNWRQSASTTPYPQSAFIESQWWWWWRPTARRYYRGSLGSHGRHVRHSQSCWWGSRAEREGPAEEEPRKSLEGIEEEYHWCVAGDVNLPQRRTDLAPGPPLGFVFSPDVRYVAAVSEDGCLRIIDALSEKYPRS